MKKNILFLLSGLFAVTVLFAGEAKNCFSPPGGYSELSGPPGG